MPRRGGHWKNRVRSPAQDPFPLRQSRSRFHFPALITGSSIRWAAMANSLEAEFQLEASLQRNERTAIARRLGDLRWHRLSNEEQASNAYQMALDLDPQDLEAIRSLLLVKESCSRFSECVDLYRRELDILEGTTEHNARRREICLRLATLLSEETDAPEQAIEAYLSAAESERLAKTDELKLARLYEQVGREDAFCETTVCRNCGCSPGSGRSKTFCWRSPSTIAC